MLKTKEGLLERDLKILKDLYDFRLLTVNQIVIRTGYAKWSIYKYIRALIKSGFVTKKRIKGYTENSNLKGDYFRITNKGITALKRNGYENLRYVSSDLKVSDIRVPIEILFNDVHYNLQQNGWTVLGSRKAKEKYGINRIDNLSGVASSPVLNNEYPFYIFHFFGDMSDVYIGKIISEINKYKFRNIVLFTTTPEMFEEIMDLMIKKADIFTYKTFRVLPLQYGLQYLINYAETNLIYDFLEDEYDILRVQKEEGVRYEADFDDLVYYEGEEYYLANLLDFNLVNYHKSKYYKKEQYEKDGRKILALVNNRINYRELFKNIHHTEFLEINPNEIIEYIY